MADLPAEIQTEDWSAYINIMPPGPSTFHVNGTLVLPTGGFEARLEPARPQGFNPTILLMNLILSPSATATETRIPVRYKDREHTDFNLYHEVTVLYLGKPVAGIPLTPVT